jgi:hypothetical protein
MNKQINDNKWEEYVLSKYKKNFDMVRSFLECAEHLQDSFSNKKIPKEKLGAKGSVLCFLFAKAYKTTKAASLLCKRGYPEDALILARANFEAALWALYILKDGADTEKEGRAFINADMFSREKALRGMLGIHGDDDQYKAELEKELDSVKKELAEMKNRDKEIYELAEKLENKRINIVGLANDVGLLVIYRSFYWISSLYAHSRARSSRSYISESKRYLEFLVCPTEEGLADVLIWLCHFLWYVMDRFNSLFNLAVEDKLKDKWKQLEDNMK